MSGTKTYQVVGITPPPIDGHAPDGGILALYDPENGEFDPANSRVRLWRWPGVQFPLGKLESASPDELPSVPERTTHWQSALAHSVGYGPFPVETLTLTIDQETP